MIVYIYNIGVDLYNGFNGLRHRINWTYFTVLDGLAHPLYSVKCNNREYEIDIYIKIDRTEPEEYKNFWNGELWLEVFHTCKVDRKQAEDFAIESLPLFETKTHLIN